MNRTDWFREAKFGVFLHYLAATYMEMKWFDKKLPDADEWNRQVDAFDVDLLATRLSSTGAGYAVVTVGQSIPHHCSPNAVYQDLAGSSGHCCSKRDLIRDLGEALLAQGMRLLVYHHGHPPIKDPVVTTAMDGNPFLEAHERWMHYALRREDPSKDPVVSGAAAKLGRFRWLHLEMTREWAARWGTNIAGWWIDGCFPELQVWDLEGELTFREYADALRAGNGKAIVAFNPALVRRLRPRTPYEDYTAGEICEALPVNAELFPLAGELDGKQGHIASFLGQHWRIGEPRFSDELVASYSQHLAENGVVVSWDVPIDEYGEVPDRYIAQLSAIGRKLGRGSAS